MKILPRSQPLTGKRSDSFSSTISVVEEDNRAVIGLGMLEDHSHA